MSWTASLRPASFRGVPFAVAGSQKEFGRRVITHLFPLRDRPFHEDMGRHPRAFSIDAFIVGHDVIARVARLEAALERKGGGLLIHPHHGSVTVVALKSAVSFAAFEGRVARIQIAFEETGAAGLPAGIVNTLGALLGLIPSALGRVHDAAAAAISLVGQVSDVREAFAGDVRALAGALDMALSSSGLMLRAAQPGAIVAGADGRTLTIPAAIERLNFASADDLGDGASVLGLAQRTVQAVASIPVELKAFAGDRDAQVNLVDALLSVSLPARRYGRQQSRKNGEAFGLAADMAAVSAAARSAGYVTWDSREQLGAYADRISARLDDLADRLGAAGWDDGWRACLDLGSAFSAHVAHIAPPLPSVRNVVLPAALPSSLLAYQLDGDDLATVFARGGSIARRNDARRPGFLPGGELLEVVANG